MKSLTDLNTFSAESVAYDDQGTGVQTLADRYQINGLIDTADNVMTNIEKICSAAGSWLSYDIHEGQWGVVINTTGTSTASFDDTNILSNISVSGTGLNDLYNNVKVEFPHRDLRDSADFVTIEIPNEDRNANEEDNALNLVYDIINEPVQAQLLGFIELKQSRVDLVITFETDYSNFNVKAGDIIDVTNERFGFDNKLFRVITTSEIQDDLGAIRISITALEYDPNVYSVDDLFRFTRTDENGIITIGSIGVPGTPQVTKFERNSRPRIVIETTAPTGVVEGIEYWLTEDVNVFEDSLRSYRLIASVRPEGGGVFASGTQVTTEYDNLTNSDFVIKTRGFNSTVVGPFSTPSGIINFTPQQITDAIGPDTVAVDATGAILTAIATNLLIKELGDLFAGSVSTGSIFSQIFELFKQETGVDLVEQVSSGTLTQAVGIAIQDEGTNLTTATSVINFVGDIVEAKSSGSVVTVSITGTSVKSINDLIDVDTTSTSANIFDSLQWDGSNWIPDGNGELNTYLKGQLGPAASGTCDIDGFVSVGRKPIVSERDDSLIECGTPQKFTAEPAIGGVTDRLTDFYVLNKTGPVDGKYNITFTSTQIFSVLPDQKFIISSIFGPANTIAVPDNITATNFIGTYNFVSTGTINGKTSLTLEFESDPGDISFVNNFRTNISTYRESIVRPPGVPFGQLKGLVINNTTGTSYSLSVNCSVGHLTHRILSVRSKYSPFGASPQVDSITGGKFLPTNSIYFTELGNNLIFQGSYSAIQSILQDGLGWQFQHPTNTSIDGVSAPSEVSIDYELTIDGISKTHIETLNFLNFKSVFPLDKRFI